MALTARELLDDSVYERADIARFLDPAGATWATFDAELGYKLRDSVMKDGLDGCYTIAHYAPTGERRMVNYASKPCRINTYGNSFTQCHQVSDGETWQEYLAAHLGEPIRNLGVGGYGVYQAYRRLLRQEATPQAAEYIILNIFDDDHFRSLDAWRWIRVGDYRDWFKRSDRRMVHCNPWAHVRLDAESGAVVECANPYPTPESLYQLCDKEHTYQAFKDDLVVQLILAEEMGTIEQRGEMERLAQTCGIDADWRTPQACQQTARALHWACALRASQYVVEKIAALAQREGKKFMVLLSYGEGNIVAACEGKERFDQTFVEYLREKGIPHVDGWQKHVEDFRAFRLTPQQYARRYYIGHYSPAGNHFFAFAIKEAVVDWLDPRPVTYRPGGDSIAAMVAALA